MTFSVSRVFTAGLQSGPRTLAAMRIVVAAQALWILLSRDPVGIAAMPPLVWQAVDDVQRLRFLLAPLPRVESVVWVAALVALTCVLVGVGTRVFGVIAALLLFHIAGMQSLVMSGGPWGKGLTIATIALPILACAPCEDRLAVAALRGQSPRREPEVYGWAVMMVRLLVAQIYLFSGLAKLLSVGIAWVSAKTIQNHLLLFAMAVPGVSATVNTWIAAHPALCLLLAAGTILFELGFVLAVFVRPLRRLLVVGAFAFHAGLWATMGFRFLNLPHLLLFIDVDPRRAAPVIPEVPPADRSV